MAEILRVALEPSDDAPIDDATRRLMLHLSIDQPPLALEPGALPVAADVPAVSAPPPSLLRRVFRRKERQQDAVQKGTAPKECGSD